MDDDNGFSSPASLSNTHSAHDKSVEQILRQLSEQNNSRWLLIYDNYDDPQLPGVSSPNGYDIRRCFPHRTHGCILVTT